MLLLAKNSTLPKLTRNGRLFLGGALLGVLVFVLVFGVSTLDATNDAFCRGGYIEKDIQQHYAGWLFYRQSSAGWPLCIARGINYPDGLSVAYTDSIPLVAVPYKSPSAQPSTAVQAKSQPKNTAGPAQRLCVAAYSSSSASVMA